MEYVIETSNLIKKYGEKFAVNNMSLHVKKGDIYGLIGKNGTGKTTLMKLILGLTLPDSGDIKLYGGENLDKARHKIGSLIEAPALYKNQSAYENMKRMAVLVPATDEKIKELLDLVGLGDVGKKKAGAFSLGMKQRLGIAMAMLGDPDLLILDEPINGLDPAGIKEIRTLILSLHEKGVTMVISSHLLDELGKIATTYGITNNGELLEISAEELKQKTQTSVKIVVDNANKAKKKLLEFDSKLEIQIGEKELTITSKVKDTSKLTKQLVENGVKVYEIKNQSVGFEDFFIERLGN